MKDTRIVAVVGPRQSGKTTLARQIAADLALTFVTLDDDQSRQFAIDDPEGLVRDLDRAVIDEIQRAPPAYPRAQEIGGRGSPPGKVPDHWLG